MCQWIGSLFAAALALGALCSPTISWSKPPDLPGDISQQCPEGRDGPQAAGFAERPAPLETSARPQTQLDRPVDPINSPRPAAQPDRSADAAEEQDAPPQHQTYRAPTESRRINLPTQLGRRAMNRNSSDEARRQEMLRSTMPLAPIPQR